MQSHIYIYIYIFLTLLKKYTTVLLHYHSPRTQKFGNSPECLGKLRRRNSEQLELSENMLQACLPLNELLTQKRCDGLFLNKIVTT